MKGTNYLTIDPGISGTGYALWTDQWHFLHAGILEAPSNLSWEEKAGNIAQQLDTLAWRRKAWKIFIEYPQFMQSKGGLVTARSGALVKLSWFVGVLSGVLTDKEVELVTVREWKGQLPKNLVVKRINRIMPGNHLKSHMFDAVGIGLYKQGRL